MKKQLLLVFLLPALYSCIPQAFVVPQIVIADSSPKASSTAIVTVSPSFAPSVEPTPTSTITPMSTVTPVSTTGNSIPTGSPVPTITPSPTATPRSGGGGGGSSSGGGGVTQPPIQASATINPDNTGVR